MKKRWFSMLVAACMIIGLVGCGSGGETKSDDAGDTSDGLKVVLIGNQRFGDNGPMDDMASGGERAAEDFGVEFKKIESECRRRKENL